MPNIASWIMRKAARGSTSIIGNDAADRTSSNASIYDMASMVFAKENKNAIMRLLTRRQQEVIEMITYYGSRRISSEKLGISLQAVHQIVLRIRKRLNKKGFKLTG